MSERVLFTLEVRVDDDGNHWAHVTPNAGADALFGPVASFSETMMRCVIACATVARDAKDEGL
jgi:hypothetical protein